MTDADLITVNGGRLWQPCSRAAVHPCSRGSRPCKTSPRSVRTRTRAPARVYGVEVLATTLLRLADQG